MLVLLTGGGFLRKLILDMSACSACSSLAYLRQPHDGLGGRRRRERVGRPSTQRRLHGLSHLLAC